MIHILESVVICCSIEAAKERVGKRNKKDHLWRWKRRRGKWRKKKCPGKAGFVGLTDTKRQRGEGVTESSAQQANTSFSRKEVFLLASEKQPFPIWEGRLVEGSQEFFSLGFYAPRFLFSFPSFGFFSFFLSFLFFSLSFFFCWMVSSWSEEESWGGEVANLSGFLSLVFHVPERWLGLLERTGFVYFHLEVTRKKKKKTNFSCCIFIFLYDPLQNLLRDSFISNYSVIFMELNQNSSDIDTW